MPIFSYTETERIMKENDKSHDTRYGSHEKRITKLEKPNPGAPGVSLANEPKGKYRKRKKN